MANLGGEFDASVVEPSTEFSAIPAGSYRCVITKSEWKDTKKGDGKYLEFAFQVVEGPYSNRLLWARLNLQNPSAQAVEISRKELSAICHAVGKLRVKDSAELHDTPLIVSVKIVKDSNGNPSNEVSGYKSVKEFAEKQSSIENQRTAAGAASNGTKPAWL